MRTIAALLVVTSLAAPGVAVACALTCSPGATHVDVMAPVAAVADHVHHHDPAVPADDAAGLEGLTAATMSCCADETPVAVQSVGRVPGVDREVARVLPPTFEATAVLVALPPAVVHRRATSSPSVHTRPPLVLRI